MTFIEFYIGINPEDSAEFMDIFDSVNNVTEPDMELLHEFDEPHGYYTYIIKGTWEQYELFLNHDASIIKSVNHYEEG
jgi:hypothetical protein